MSAVMLISAQVALGPPGAAWHDALFAYGSMLLIVALAIWQELNETDPPKDVTGEDVQ